MGIDYPPPSHPPSPPNLTPSPFSLLPGGKYLGHLSGFLGESSQQGTWCTGSPRCTSRSLSHPGSWNICCKRTKSDKYHIRMIKRTDRRHRGSLCYKQGALVWQQLAISWNRNSTFSLRSLSKATIMHYNKYELHDPSVLCQPLFSEFIATTTYLSRSFALPALSRTEYIKQIVANVHRITLTFSNYIVWKSFKFWQVSGGLDSHLPPPPCQYIWPPKPPNRHEKKSRLKIVWNSEINGQIIWLTPCPPWSPPWSQPLETTQLLFCSDIK